MPGLELQATLFADCQVQVCWIGVENQVVFRGSARAEKPELLKLSLGDPGQAVLGVRHGFRQFPCGPL